MLDAYRALHCDVGCDRLCTVRDTLERFEMAKHEHDDLGNQFETREETKSKVIVWVHTTCSKCGAVVNTDKDREEQK